MGLSLSSDRFELSSNLDQSALKSFIKRTFKNENIDTEPKAAQVDLTRFRRPMLGESFYDETVPAEKRISLVRQRVDVKNSDLETSVRYLAAQEAIKAHQNTQNASSDFEILFNQAKKIEMDLKNQVENDSKSLNPFAFQDDAENAELFLNLSLVA